jgi:head-tail adaptor
VLSRRAASDPGRLRLRLTLEKPAPVPDGAGGSTLSWEAAATIAADVIALRADERIMGEGLASVTRHRIVIRHGADVAAGDRFRLVDGDGGGHGDFVRGGRVVAAGRRRSRSRSECGCCCTTRRSMSRGRGW